MKSLATALRKTRQSFPSDRFCRAGSTLVRRSVAPLLGAFLLLSLSQNASAEEQAPPPKSADAVPGATTAEQESTDETVTNPEEASEPGPTPGPSPTPTESSQPSEPAAPGSGSTKVVSSGATEEDLSCGPSVSDYVPVPFAAPAASLSPEQNRALWPLRWKKSPGQGFSFGMEEGLWGNSWSQGLRISIPFTRYLGTTLRGIYLIDMAGGPFTADAGGRIDFFGRSPAMLNVVRLYGGGGVQVLAPTANTSGREVKVGVGGHFGFEFFHNPYFSYFLEVGGQGGEPSPGATVVAGLMFFPWTR